MRKFGFNLLVATFMTAAALLMTAVTIPAGGGPGPCCFS